MAPRPAPSLTAADGDTIATLSSTEVHGVVLARCASCHADVPTQPGFVAPPQGIVFNTVEQMEAQAQTIYQQTVVTKAMPIGNLTGITDDERAAIATWYQERTQ